jgi:cardiolipin synthase C
MSDRKAPAEPTTLSAAIATHLEAHATQSGVRLIPDGFEAFELRVHSLRLAQLSIDVQTYIWRDDPTGRYIAHELLLAADRGLIVRVLLDDMDARPRDLALQALDAHPNIEVRIFNPFRTRSGLLRTLAEVSRRGRRLNHRMHNKSWIVDGSLAICGGRNIGDEYFASAREVNFIDLDVLMLGPAVDQAAVEFERYWNARLSVHIGRLRKYIRKRLHLRRHRERLQQSTQQAPSDAYSRHLEKQDGRAALLECPFVWSRDVRAIADDPRKAYGDSGASHVLTAMATEIRAASREVLLISPYFVPGLAGTAALRSLAMQGASVRILTNSLAATDVAIVHSGYAKYRHPLLEAGVRIFEMKFANSDQARSRFRLGSSRASLHTKAVILDGQRVFVGSFNLDPRSAELNCEMGIWIRSRQLALELTADFRSGIDPERSFALQIDGNDDIEWVEKHDGELITHSREPYASWTRRLIVRLLQSLPIESQL